MQKDYPQTQLFYHHAAAHGNESETHKPWTYLDSSHKEPDNQMKTTNEIGISKWNTIVTIIHRKIIKNFTHPKWKLKSGGLRVTKREGEKDNVDINKLKYFH